ncbi:MAG: hypothetical protein DMG69_23350 [Acidobacteria bacterium]|nr:MAG: hypothetical protein DMG69_23350 [Acidobacteriota bacterium]
MGGRGGDLVHFDQCIVGDPQICGGEPVFKGTRVTLRTVLPSLAAGDTPEAILAAFPSLKAEEEGPVGWFNADIRRVLGD